MYRPCVAIVDADTAFVSVLRAELQERGCIVHAFRDLRAVSGHHSLDLVVVDVSELAEDEAAVRRARIFWAGARVLGTIGARCHAHEPQQSLAAALGATLVLRKPFDPVRLVDEIAATRDTGPRS